MEKNQLDPQKLRVLLFEKYGKKIDVDDPLFTSVYLTKEVINFLFIEIETDLRRHQLAMAIDRESREKMESRLASLLTTLEMRESKENSERNLSAIKLRRGIGYCVCLIIGCFIGAAYSFYFN